MSFVIVLYVREGIVMASDSRLTLNTQEEQLGKTIVNLAVGQSDTTYKTFLTPGGVGISTFGAADISGVPLAGFIDSFISDVLGDERHQVQAVATKLLAHFKKFEPQPDTHFLVAGYNAPSAQEVWNVSVLQGNVIKINPGGQPGATWGGEGDILTRILQPVATLDGDGNIQQRLPTFGVPWQFFTLQDAIDFAVFAVRSTSDAIRFQPRAKTVGGPVDVLVIRPDRPVWVQRKELRVG